MSMFLKNSKSESHSVVSDSLQPYGLYSPWNSPGQNTGVGSLSLLQGIFPTQRSNPGLMHCRQILYQLSHKTAVFSHNSGGWKSKIKVLAKLISGMTSLLGLQTLFTVLAHGLFSVCAPGVHSASYK